MSCYHEDTGSTALMARASIVLWKLASHYGPLAGCRQITGHRCTFGQGLPIFVSSLLSDSLTTLLSSLAFKNPCSHSSFDICDASLCTGLYHRRLLDIWGLQQGVLDCLVPFLFYALETLLY